MTMKNKNKLRSVRVTFDNGDVITTDMAAGLSDADIKSYYKKGKVFNLGRGDKDLLVKVHDVDILESVFAHTDVEDVVAEMPKYKQHSNILNDIEFQLYDVVEALPGRQTADQLVVGVDREGSSYGTEFFFYKNIKSATSTSLNKLFKSAVDKTVTCVTSGHVHTEVESVGNDNFKFVMTYTKPVNEAREGIVLAASCVCPDSRYEYRWKLVKAPDDKSTLWVEQNIGGEWRGVPSGWYVKDLVAQVKEGSLGDSIAIDAGQNWIVTGLRGAVKEADSLISIQERKKSKLRDTVEEDLYDIVDDLPGEQNDDQLVTGVDSDTAGDGSTLLFFYKNVEKGLDAAELERWFKDAISKYDWHSIVSVEVSETDEDEDEDEEEVCFTVNLGDSPMFEHMISESEDGLGINLRSLLDGKLANNVLRDLYKDMEQRLTHLRKQRPSAVLSQDEINGRINEISLSIVAVQQAMLQDYGSNYNSRNELIDDIEKSIIDCDWMSLSNGTMYTKTFQPGKK